MEAGVQFSPLLIVRIVVLGDSIVVPQCSCQCIQHALVRISVFVTLGIGTDDVPRNGIQKFVSSSKLRRRAQSIWMFVFTPGFSDVYLLAGAISNVPTWV